MPHGAESRLRAFGSEKEIIERQLIESGRFAGVRYCTRRTGIPGIPSRRGPTFPDKQTKLRFDAEVQRLLGEESQTPGVLASPLPGAGASTSTEGQTMTWQLFKNGQLAGQTTELSVKEQWEADGGTATLVEGGGGGGGDDPNTVLEPERIGADTPTGDAQVGDPLTIQEILNSIGTGSGTITEEQALDLLQRHHGISSIEEAQSQVDAGPAGGIPTAPTAPVSPPTDVTDLLQNLGVGDITRRFAIESGVSPDFRNLVQGRAQEQLLPFALQTARGFDPSQLGEGEKLSDLFSTRRFQDFLGDQGGFQSRGVFSTRGGRFSS